MTMTSWMPLQGSVAIPLAIKSDDWEYAQHFIKERIENKMHSHG
jgi:hypothetical protein